MLDVEASRAGSPRLQLEVPLLPAPSYSTSSARLDGHPGGQQRHQRAPVHHPAVLLGPVVRAVGRARVRAGEIEEGGRQVDVRHLLVNLGNERHPAGSGTGIMSGTRPSS